MSGFNHPQIRVEFCKTFAPPSDHNALKLNLENLTEAVGYKSKIKEGLIEIEAHVKFLHKDCEAEILSRHNFCCSVILSRRSNFVD